MSNIFTDFVRVYAQPGHDIDRVEAAWITWALLGPRGSYHVPVVTRVGSRGRYVDVQYGSGKSADIVDFCDNHVGYRYRAIWGRRFDEGGDEDVLWQDDVSDGPRRLCRGREGEDVEGRAWRHHCADDWDNCLDPEFLRFTGATHLLAPDLAYRRDRQDWENRPRFGSGM